MSDYVKEKTGIPDRSAEKAAQARALLRIRGSLGESRSQFAKALDASASSYGEWETGKVLAARRLGWLIRRAYPDADISALSEIADAEIPCVQEQAARYNPRPPAAIYRHAVARCGECHGVVGSGLVECPHCGTPLAWPAAEGALHGGADIE